MHTLYLLNNVKRTVSTFCCVTCTTRNPYVAEIADCTAFSRTAVVSTLTLAIPDMDIFGCWKFEEIV